MRTGTRTTIAIVSFLLLGYIVYPLAAVFMESTSGSSASWSVAHYTSFLTSEWDRWPDSAIWGSFWISLATVILSAGVGVPLALLFGGREFPGRRVLGALMALPLALPPLVGVLAFQRIFSIDPLLGRWFGLEPIEGVPMVLLVHVYSFFVYFYMFTRTGLEGLDPSLAEAARSLGASRARTFFLVTLPALRPQLYAAAVVTFMVSMASFTAPFVFSTGQLRVLSVEIQVATEANRPHAAAVQSVFLAVVCIGFLLFMRTLEGRRSGASATKGVAARREPVAHRGVAYLLTALGAALVLVSALPHITIVGLSLGVLGTGSTETATFDHYLKIFSDEESFRPIANSLRLALAATLCNFAFGLAAGYLIGRIRFRGQAFVDVGAMLPFALPGTVIAFCLITAFNEPSWLSGGQVLVGTSGILMLSYFIRHIPLAVRPTVASFRTLDPALEEASSGLGASGTQTLSKVLLPCVLPGLLAGCLLGFVTALGEFVSSIMLYAPHNEPISVSIWQKMDQYKIAQAAAYSVLLMILVGITLIIYGLMTRSTSRGLSARL